MAARGVLDPALPSRAHWPRHGSPTRSRAKFPPHTMCAATNAAVLIALGTWARLDQQQALITYHPARGVYGCA